MHLEGRSRPVPDCSPENFALDQSPPFPDSSDIFRRGLVPWTLGSFRMCFPSESVLTKTSPARPEQGGTPRVAIHGRATCALCAPARFVARDLREQEFP